jgi:acyl-CoA thioester hydrolase
MQPIIYGDTIEVKTWVGDFRRVRSRRFYEFRKAGQTELVARASTDWVYLEYDTLRPATVPLEMMAAFAPDGDVKISPPRQRFPDSPPPPLGAFTMRRRVEWRDIDTAQHVNNAAYINYLEDCGMEVSKAHGWPLARTQSFGFAVLARRHQIEYRLPARLDDELNIVTWASDAKRISALRHYAIMRDNELLVRAQTLWVWVDLATRKPMRIPADFLADFAPNMID